MNEFSPKVTQVCGLKKGRTQMGFRKIKVTDPACEQYEKEEQLWQNLILYAKIVGRE